MVESYSALTNLQAKRVVVPKHRHQNIFSLSLNVSLTVASGAQLNHIVYVQRSDP